MAEARFGLTKGLAFRNTECVQCSKAVRPFDEVMFDTLRKVGDIEIHCLGCGTMLRFHRKRAVARGENPPLSIAEVDERLGLTT